MAGQYSEETRTKARDLWLQGVDGKDIVQQCGLNNIRVLYQWIEKYGWKKLKAPEHFALSTSVRYNKLMSLDRPLTEQECTEVELLANILLKHEQIKINAEYGNASGGRQSTKSGKNNKKKAEKLPKNEVSHLTSDEFKKFRDEELYAHQMDWYEAGQNPETYRQRFILKTRRGGGTFYFAYEAFENAVLHGQTSIFISATRQQAEVFKTYISIIAKRFFGVEISGNPCLLDNDAQFIYVSTRVESAQSYGGNVYWDEAFWTPKFTELFDVSSPMAAFTEFRKTILSTPSTISHDAYKKWTGEEYNEDRPDADKVSFKVNHEALKHGRLCEDGWWRQIVTLQDAVDRGYDKIDIEQIKRETPPSKYRNFYECQFVDDSQSVFDINDLLGCIRDPIIIKGFNKDASKPYGNKAVAVGYDPSGEGDKATAAAMTLPSSIDQKFQLLEMETLPPKAASQAARLKKWKDKYNIQHLELDGTGVGLFVVEFVEPFYPSVKVAHYNPKYKTLLVQKAQDVIQSGRFEFDIRHKSIALAFMTVRQTMTKNNQVTYESVRTKESGHGDEAWSCMHAFMGEELNPNNPQTMEINTHER